MTAEPIRFDCIFFTGGKKNAEPVPVGPVLIVTLPCPDGYGGCVARRSSCVVMCVAQMRVMCVVVCGRARCVVVVCGCCVVRLVQHDSTVKLPLGIIRGLFVTDQLDRWTHLINSLLVAGSGRL